MDVHGSMRLEYGRHIDSCINMYPSVQNCKEVKKAKRVAQSKQGKHNIIAWSRKRCVSSTPTSQRCVSQAIIKQVASKTDKYKPTEGTKQGKAVI